MLLIATAAILVSSSSPAVTLRSHVVLSGREVRIRDLVVEKGRLPAASLSLVVFRLPRAAGYKLSGTQAASLVQRRVPGLVVRVPEREVRFAVSLEPNVSPRGACLALNRAVAPGETVLRRDIVRVPCVPASVPTAVRYRKGVLISPAALAKGAYLGPVSLTSIAPDISSGTTLTLRSTAGAVVVERSVVTLQPGRLGRPVFVRASDGAVLSVRLEDGR